MSRTTLKQKITLILFGLLLGIILLEIGLRIGGAILLHIQERANQISLKEKGDYIILCLGESTTQNGGFYSYPRQLERILNNCNLGIKFTVINKGIGATNTTYIVSSLEENLNKYSPNMVITMMGINDGPGTVPYEDNITVKSKLFLENFRVYKLTRLLREHILYKIQEINNSIRDNHNKITQSGRVDSDAGRSRAELPPLVQTSTVDSESLLALGDDFLENINLDEAARLYDQAVLLSPDECCQRYINLARLYHRRGGDLEKAEIYYKKALAIIPYADQAYAHLGTGLIALYREQANFKEWERLARLTIKQNPKNGSAYSELGRLYEEKGDISNAIIMYEESFNINPMLKTPFSQLLYLYSKSENFKEIERICKKLISINPNDDQAYAALSSCYQRMGNNELSDKYLGIMDQLRTKYYNPNTACNYRKLSEIISNKNIQLVCVQYPTRNADNLQKMLPASQGIIFVDNGRIFRDALKHGKYEDLFYDKFAGDFGHCTPRGNQLLAENIAHALLLKYFNYLTTSQIAGVNSYRLLSAYFGNTNLMFSDAQKVVVSSQISKEQSEDKLTDINKDTFWHISCDRLGEPAWVMVDFGEGNKKRIKSLAAFPRKDIPRQFFRKAKFFGSDNGEDWEFISDIVQADVPDNSNWREWRFDNDRAFQYYKLLIIDGHEDGNAHRFYSMSELAMFE